MSPKPNTGFCAFFFKVYGSKTIYSFNVHVHCVGSPSSNKFSFFVSVNICCLVLLYIYCVVYRFSLCGLEGGGGLRFGFLLHIPSAYTGLVKDETNEFIFTLNSAEIQPRPLKYCLINKYLYITLFNSVKFEGLLKLHVLFQAKSGKAKYFLFLDFPSINWVFSYSPLPIPLILPLSQNKWVIRACPNLAHRYTSNLDHRY